MSKPCSGVGSGAQVELPEVGRLVVRLNYQESLHVEAGLDGLTVVFLGEQGQEAAHLLRYDDLAQAVPSTTRAD